jgi:cleavage stimulation factor subunit 2
VFVGNIPYDATEEKLKEIFCEVGPVQSFRLVYDRDTGKPKGYGFCEYKDTETAHSAIRNLNNIELSGRTLRVDSAANERNREEMRNLPPPVNPAGSLPPIQPFIESPYGAPDVDPEKAPEAISKVVASLPPEQMFELATQMRNCVQSNPHEARNMLMQNPQLAYALLQALVVMRAVKPEVAASILHRPSPQVAPVMPVDQPYPGPSAGYQQVPPNFGRAGPAVADPRRSADPRVADPRVRNQMVNAAAQPMAGLQDNAEILQRVMLMTEEEIQKCPLREQEHIRQLRHAMGL